MMNILYCGDANIADGVILSAMSLAAHVTEPLRVEILTASVTAPGREITALHPSFATWLEGEMCRRLPGSTVRLHDVTALFEAEKPVANMDTRFTPCCMLRLFADQVPELPDRLLYLDNDVICRGDIAPLYGQEMAGVPLAGVLDFYGSWLFRQNPFRRDYLNSGVLLLNMEEIRRSGLFAACRRRCREKQMFMPDQSALNKLAAGKRILPRRYNEQRRLHKDTVLQHFTTSFRLFPYFHAVSVKPWNVEGMHTVLKLHDYDDLIAEYQKMKESYHEFAERDPAVFRD